MWACLTCIQCMRSECLSTLQVGARSTNLWSFAIYTDFYKSGTDSGYYYTSKSKTLLLQVQLKIAQSMTFMMYMQDCPGNAKFLWHVFTTLTFVHLTNIIALGMPHSIPGQYKQYITIRNFFTWGNPVLRDGLGCPVTIMVLGWTTLQHEWNTTTLTLTFVELALTSEELWYSK